MQWIALRAPMPVLRHHHKNRSVSATAAGRFDAELQTSLQTPRLSRDSSSLSLLRYVDRARLRWIPNFKHGSTPCCLPLCAVNPRSRKEWLLLHNLPDPLGKGALNGQEEKELQNVRDDVGAVESLESKDIEVIEKTVGRRGDARADSLVNISNKNPDDAVEIGDGENGQFRQLNPGDRTERRRKWIESLEKTHSGWTYQAQDGDPETWNSVGSRQRAESTSLRSSDETLRARRVWRNGEPLERHSTPFPRYGTDGYAKARERTKKEELRPRVAPQKQLIPEKSEETNGARRDLWKKGPVVESYHQQQDLADLRTRKLEESFSKRQSNPGAVLKGNNSSESLSAREPSNNRRSVDRPEEQDPSFVHSDTGFSEKGNFGLNIKESNVVVEANAGNTKERGQLSECAQEAVEGLEPYGLVSLEPQGGDHVTEKVDKCSNEEEEKLPVLMFGKREMVDYNGEKVVEVWKKGRVVKRYKPLGMEFLYGRTKPTRLYGPLNSRGEVPGSDLAPVPRRYRDRCEHGKGWSTKEVVAKVLELNHWDDIDVVLNKWVGRFNRKNFPPLMLAMTRTGAIKHSVRLFTWMKNQRCYRARTDIYNLMIWLYARHYRVDAVRAHFYEMQEWRCKPDVETYNALINVHGRARQWRESLFYYDRMLRAAVPPSTYTYNNLISACGNSGQWTKALALYEKMKSDGVNMDVVTHNTVLTALKIGEQYAKAIEHFEKMLQWKVLPDTVTVNIIISCFSKMERYDEALQLFNSMIVMKWDGCQPDLVTFTTVMHVYAVSGQVVDVKAVFDTMVREGVVPNIVAYNTLIGAYSSLGMDVEALQVFESMQKVGFEPDIVSYTALMNAYSKSGKPDDAASLFELMKKRSRKPNIVTYNTLIDAFTAAGQLTKALGLLPDMDYDGVPPNVVTICSLIVGCGRSGEIGRVSSILKVAAERKISLNVNVYNTVLSVYLNHGLFEEAEEVFATMKEEGIAPDSVSFAVLINGAAKVRNSSQAQIYFDEMLSLGIGINVDACSALIHAYAEQGLPEAAHAMLTRMKEYGCAPNVLTYTSLIHAYTSAEMPMAAIAVFEEMEDLGVELDVVACSALFTVFNQCGQAEKTLLLWSKWREHLQFGIAAFVQLSKACCMLTDWKMALELFDNMQQVGVNLNYTIGKALLRSLTEGGEIEQMSKILDRFKAGGLQPDLKTYTMVLKCLEIVQLWDIYIEVYDQMMASGCSLDLDLSKVMVKALGESGQAERAWELESSIQNFMQEVERNLRKAVPA